jgi:hypothetical protein
VRQLQETEVFLREVLGYVGNQNGIQNVFFFLDYTYLTAHYYKVTTNTQDLCVLSIGYRLVPLCVAHPFIENTMYLKHAGKAVLIRQLYKLVVFLWVLWQYLNNCPSNVNYVFEFIKNP